METESAPRFRSYKKPQRFRLTPDSFRKLEVIAREEELRKTVVAELALKATGVFCEDAARIFAFQISR
jgi:hypothetical protein